MGDYIIIDVSQEEISDYTYDVYHARVYACVGVGVATRRWYSSGARVSIIRDASLLHVVTFVYTSKRRVYCIITLSLASMSHFAFISISMISIFPREDAQWIGALPYWKTKIVNNIVYAYTLAVMYEISCSINMCD